MTLGSDPQSETPQPPTAQPLTRRQARERARNAEPEQNAEQSDARQQDAKPVAKPASRRAGTEAAIQAGDTPQFASPRARVETEPVLPPSPAAPPVDSPVSSFAPRPANTQADPPPTGTSTSGTPTPERTLTRRELRAMKAAEDAETGAQQVIDDGTSAADDGDGDESPATWNGDSKPDPHTQVVDGGQPFDQLISRGVGAGGIPTTSNALILPSVPQQGTRSGPLTSTGEILITGSIDLPRSLGATGQHPNHFDSSEMDHMLDQLDEGAATSSVAPVSASRAVSTHTSTRGVMTPPKKSGVSLPSVLAITAAVLAAGVVALFIVGYIFKIF